jgi:acetylornithine/N-succinyldiaminopimelate aminotransferase
LIIKSGKGVFLETTDGQKYLDCVSGIATCILGHNNPELTKAVSDQMAKVHHVSNLYLIPEQAALAAWLCDNSNAEKAFFCNSGAEANEAAIKCARRNASNRGITVRSSYSFTNGRDAQKLMICTTVCIVTTSTETRNYFR